MAFARTRLQEAAELFGRGYISALSLKDAAIAKAKKEERVPTLEQIRRVLAVMPTESDTDKRNRALLAFILMTGARRRRRGFHPLEARQS